MKRMNRRNKTKAAAAGAVLLAFVLTSAACSSNNGLTDHPNTNQEEQHMGQDFPLTNNIPDNSGLMDSGIAAPAGNEQEAATDSILTGEGIYNGLSDSNSIEIKDENGTEIYRLPSHLRDSIMEMDTDINVRYEYTEKREHNEVQNMLVSIEPLE